MLQWKTGFFSKVLTVEKSNQLFWNKDMEETPELAPEDYNVQHEMFLYTWCHMTKQDPKDMTSNREMGCKNQLQKWHVL